MKRVFTISLFLLCTPILFAQSLSLTGRLNEPRWLHESQLLRNGKVLAFGGDDGVGVDESKTYATAELYDPVTERWSYTGEMQQARSTFASAVLPDGRVLAIGGQDELLNEIKNCEIYDPATSRWTMASELNFGRHGHDAVILSDGRILVAGGLPITNTTEIYDPATGDWSLTGTMKEERGEGLSLVLLSDGRVLATGGESSYDTGELYDPATGEWTLLSDKLNYVSFTHQSILLNDGRVLLTGSGGFSFNNKGAEIFDPSDNTFTTTGDLQEDKDSNPMIKLDDGNILSFGFGNFLNPINTKIIEIYDVVNGTWSSPVYTTLGANNYTIHRLHNGRILVLGGIFTTFNGSSDVCWLIDAGLRSNLTEATPIDVRVFPNPASDWLRFELPKEFSAADSKLSIVDASGKAIAAEITLQEASSNIPVFDWPKGMYYFKIQDAKAIRYSGQFMLH